MRKHAKRFTQPSMTKQSHKKECDINQIMAKYQKSGVVTHVKTHGLHYGEYDAIDFTDAMNTIAEGQSMFAELPSQARKKFDNDPAKFMEYVNNPENQEHLYELGLARPTNPVEETVLPPKAPKEATEPEKVDL